MVGIKNFISSCVKCLRLIFGGRTTKTQPRVPAVNVYNLSAFPHVVPQGLLHRRSANAGGTISQFAVMLAKDAIMAQVSAPVSPFPQPLVSLTDDEILFRDNIRQF